MRRRCCGTSAPRPRSACPTSGPPLGLLGALPDGDGGVAHTGVAGLGARVVRGTLPRRPTTPNWQPAPTTDNLDVDSAEALEEGLESYQGSVVAVPHDRWFARSFDRFLVFGSAGAVYPSTEPVWDEARVVRAR